MDLTKAPAPVLRWLGILVIAIVYAALGTPIQGYDWIWPAIFAGALILPDVAGFAIGGFRLDLQQAQDDIERLKLRIEMSQTLNLHFHGATERTYERTLGIEIGEKAAASEEVTLIDTDPGQDSPS